MKDSYDIAVIGAGLAGLTAANRLARAGYRVLLLEQHTQLGGLATFFRRRGHIFDVALHGFPVGMRKSLRKYWGRDFAEQVVQVRSIRFDNPQYKLESTFDTRDFSAKLTGHFGISSDTVGKFFEAIASMNFYDSNRETTREFFDRFFPGRTDVWRFLMEPIAYANGSTLDEPAISYGIVFGNFMSEGVYTFQGGTDKMLGMMAEELRRNGVDVEMGAPVSRILVDSHGQGGRPRVRAVVVDGREIGCRAVVSNGNLFRTVRELVGEASFTPEFVQGLSRVRPSTSSCQVYIGIKPGVSLPFIGDLLFASTWPEFDSEAMLARPATSRTFSVYYPALRPDTDRCSVVASMNARHGDWSGLAPEEYRRLKADMIEDTLDDLERFLPDIRKMTDYCEAATPCTFERYTGHWQGATFGTKFEGLDFSMKLHEQVSGLFHAGSVGIIMSGWLGAVNYGVITANEADRYLTEAR